MPYNAENPDKDLILKIRQRHPMASASDIRQWIHVFNGSFDRAVEDGKSDGEAEGIAFRNAWGVLKKNLASSSTTLVEVSAAPVPSLVQAAVRDHFKQADDYQIAAASSSGKNVVGAGAGAGKTATMVARIKYVMEELGVSPSQFLVCSFGKESTGDMAERIKKAVGNRASQMTISTIHALCMRALKTMKTPEGKILGNRGKRILGTYGSDVKYMNFLIETLEGQVGKGISETLKTKEVMLQMGKWKSAQVRPQEVASEFRQISDLHKGDKAPISIKKTRNDNGYDVRTSAVNDKDKVIAFLYNLYEAFKWPQGIPSWAGGLVGDAAYWEGQFTEYNAVRGIQNVINFVDGPAFDFTDMQLAFLWHLKNTDGFKDTLQNRWSQIYVDECQDTSPLQFEIVKTLGDHVAKDDPVKTLWMVGDDKQSIYFFRGTRPDQFIDLANDPDWNYKHMPNNYRSTSAIVEMADALVGNNTKQLPMKAVPSGPNKDHNGDVELHRPETTADGAERVADKILRAVESDATSVGYDDYAVIARTNSEVGVYELEMLLSGVPYVRKGGQRFLNAKELQIVLGYIRIVMHRLNPGSVSRNLLTDAMATCLNHPERVMLNARAFKGPFLEKNKGWDEMVACSAGRGIVADMSTKQAKWATISCRKFVDQINDIVDILRSEPETDTLELIDLILDLITTHSFDGNIPLREYLHIMLSKNDDEGDGKEATEDNDGEDEIELNIGNVKVLQKIAKKQNPRLTDASMPDGFLKRISEIEAIAEENTAQTTIIQKDPRTGRRVRVPAPKPTAVSLMTAHASKGLEWDHTFVLMPAYRFPLYGIMKAAEDAEEFLAENAELLAQSTDPKVLKVATDAKEAIAEYEAERRLAYVAMTRAKKSIYIMSPAKSDSGKDIGISPFINEAQVEEYATYSDLSSLFEYDSLEEAIQALITQGRNADAVALSGILQLRNEGSIQQARIEFARNESLWPVVAATRGTRDIQSTAFKIDWPSDAAIKANIPVARYVFPVNETDPTPVPLELKAGIWDLIDTGDLGGFEEEFAGLVDDSEAIPVPAKENLKEDVAAWAMKSYKGDADFLMRTPSPSGGMAAAFFNDLKGHFLSQLFVRAIQRVISARRNEVSISIESQGDARQIWVKHPERFVMDMYRAHHNGRQMFGSENTDQHVKRWLREVWHSDLESLEDAFGVRVEDVQAFVLRIQKGKYFNTKANNKDVLGTRTTEEFQRDHPVYKYDVSLDTGNIAENTYQLFDRLRVERHPMGTVSSFICEFDIVAAAAVTVVTDEEYGVWCVCEPNRLVHVSRLVEHVQEDYRRGVVSHPNRVLRFYAHQKPFVRLFTQMGFYVHGTEEDVVIMSPDPKIVPAESLGYDPLVPDSLLDDEIEIAGMTAVITRPDDYESGDDYYVIQIESRVPFEDVQEALADLLGVEEDEINEGTDPNQFILMEE